MQNANLDFNQLPPSAKEFLSYMLTIKGKSKNTVNEYFFDLRTFFRYMKQNRKMIDESITFDKIPINDIDLEFIKTITLTNLFDFLSYAAYERENENASRARKVACLKSFFNYLFKNVKQIPTNPAAELESPKISKRLPKYMTIEESVDLLTTVENSNSEFKERDFAILTLFLNCGMRLSELVGININKIKNDTLTVIGKGDKERTIYLNSACIEAINSYMKVRTESKKETSALFLSKRQTRISVKTVQWLVKKYITAAGLDSEKYSVHKLRHTAATLMYKHGHVDIRALQAILGHESVATTEIYTHLDDENLRNAAKSNPLANFKKSEKPKK